MGKEVLEHKILGQTAQMNYYSRMVENVKENHETVYKDIYSVLDMSQQSKQPVSNRQLCEFKPDFNLRPAPLTSHSTLMEIHQFYAQFSKYIKSSNSVPDGIIYAQAAVTMDIFWLTEIKKCDFEKDTNLKDFICLIKDVTLSKFSLDTR